MPARASKLVLWLLLGVVLLIAYGSLYPFHFKPDAVNGSFWKALDQLSWARAGRGDRISNVLLYLPLGFCLLLSLNRRFGRVASVLLAMLLGAVLSLAMELAQVYVSARVPSLTDLSLNAAGTLLGAAVGMAWGTIGGWMHFPARAEKPAGDPGAALLVGLWLAWRLAPFVPLFDLGKLKAALRPLFDPQLDPAATFVYLSYWLVVSEALTALVSKPHTLEALLVLIATVLVGRLVVANQTFVAAELLALVLLLPLLVVTMRLTPQPKRLLLLGMLLSAFVIERLAPFQFTTTATAFDLRPFLPLLSHLAWQDAGQALATIDIVGVFGRLFLFGALVWTLRETGVSMTLAAIAMVLLVTFTEVLRLWLVDGSASLTDILLAAVVGVTFRYVHQQRRNRTLLARASSRRGRSR
jgi:VanZ family protein